MSKPIATDSSIIKKQTTGEQAWSTFLTVILKASERTKLRIPETLVSGWTVKKPTVIFTDDSGFLKKSKDVSTGFISNFLSFCPKVDIFPVCIGRQLSTFAILDNKSAMTLWHKSLVANRPFFIQRFISQGGEYSSLVRIIWRPDSVVFVTFINQVPHSGFVKRRSMLSIGKVIMSAEDRFFTRPEQASKSAEISNKEELEEFTETVANMYKKAVNEQYQFLSEMVLEFVKEKEGDWFLIRVPSYEISRNLQSSVPILTPIRLKNRNWLRVDEASYKNLSIKRMSQTILSIKQSLGMTITSGDRERLASYTDFSKKLKQRSSLPQIKPRKQKVEEKRAPTYLVLEPVSKSVSHQDMPPLFQFPTPRENEELNRSAPGPKVDEIKAYIHRQNNSMYMRIHYQEELSEERKIKRYAQQSVSFVAEEYDRLRERGIEGRYILRSHQDEIYRGYSIA